MTDLRKEDDGVEELLERDPSVSIPEDVLLAHAQRGRELLLRQRRPHHHDDVTGHVFQL